MVSCMRMMRFAAVSVLLLVTCVRDGWTQPPSTQAPTRAIRHVPKPRAPDCDPRNTPAASDAHEPVVSAPPSDRAGDLRHPALLARVTVPIPTLPQSETPPAPGCPDARGSTSANTSAADFPSARMQKFQHDHPEAVRTMMRINTTLPGWTLRADTIIDGSAIAGGVAYRHGLDEDRASFDLMGMVSIRTYYLVTAGFSYARAVGSAAGVPRRAAARELSAGGLLRLRPRLLGRRAHRLLAAGVRLRWAASPFHRPPPSTSPAPPAC